jgi:hypothetical protein
MVGYRAGSYTAGGEDVGGAKGGFARATPGREPPGGGYIQGYGVGVPQNPFEAHGGAYPGGGQLGAVLGSG